MDLLSFSQILFNFIASVVMIMIGVLVGVITAQIIKAIKLAHKVADEMSALARDIQLRVDNLIAAFNVVPFLSKLIKKKSAKKQPINHDEK